MQTVFGNDVITVTNHVALECIIDPFETAETRQRAVWYQVSAIPDVRVDGKYSAVGAVGCPQAFLAYQSRVLQRQLETGGQSPIEIQGGYDQDASALHVSARFTLVDPVTLSDLQATILLYEDGIHQSGQFFYDDDWNRVTRVISNQSITLANPGDEVVVNVDIPLDVGWNPANLHLVAFVQRTMADREIYQAARLDSFTSGTGPSAGAGATGIEEIRPNPFRGGTEITFNVSPASAGPVRLELFDTAGRKVASLQDGALGAGRQSRYWDGRRADGSPAGNGVYFARLITREGQQAQKLILVRD